MAFDKNGLPLAHEVFEGNIGDTETQQVEVRKITDPEDADSTLVLSHPAAAWMHGKRHPGIDNPPRGSRFSRSGRPWGLAAWAAAAGRSPLRNLPSLSITQAVASLSSTADSGWLALVGCGGKRVYVLPAHGLVIARDGRSRDFSDAVFLQSINVS